MRSYEKRCRQARGSTECPCHSLRTVLPLNHEYKCSHMGHAGACKYACCVCDGYWDDVQLQCGCGFDRSLDDSRLCAVCPESQEGNVSSGEWSGAVRAATAAAAALTATAIFSAASVATYDSV